MVFSGKNFRKKGQNMTNEKQMLFTETIRQFLKILPRQREIQ